MTGRPILRSALGLAGWLALCFLAAAVGAAASLSARGFYQGLIRPAWAPPGSLFGPVWTILYLLMALSAWRVGAAAGARKARLPLALFLIQLALNALWPWLFFQWHLGSWAFAEIILLGCAILATGLLFWPASRIAAVLLIPYLAWVTFAAFLTWSVWRANPGLLG